MYATFHNDVRNVLIDRLSDYYGTLPTDSTDLAFDLLADENANGTHFFSRSEASDYIDANGTEVRRVADAAQSEWGALDDPDENPEGYHVQLMLFIASRIMGNAFDNCGFGYDVDEIDDEMKQQLIDELEYENRSNLLVI